MVSMELNKFTNKSKEIINSAQVLAMMNNHQVLKTIHLLKPLTEEDDFRNHLTNALSLQGFIFTLEKKLEISI